MKHTILYTDRSTRDKTTNTSKSMRTQWLINPFKKVAGWKALVIGMAVMTATALLGKMNHLFFDGTLDVHAFPHSFSEAFMAQGIHLILPCMVMWLAGVLFSKSKIRMIDIAGTMALSRYPMLLLAVIGFLPIVPEGLFDTVPLVIFIIICIPFIIWMIALMYHAFAVSCNLRGQRGAIVFIGALIVAEILSKLLLSYYLEETSSFSNENPPATEHLIATEQARREEVFQIPEGQTIQQTADKVVEYFDRGEYGKIALYFDEKMKEGLNSHQLRVLWMQLISLNGRFEEADTDIKAMNHDEYEILMVPCHFSRKDITLQLTFNKSGQISGMFIRPPANEK